MSKSQILGFIGSCLLIIAAYVVSGLFYTKTDSWFVHDYVVLYVGAATLLAMWSLRNVNTTWQFGRFNVSSFATCHVFLWSMHAVVFVTYLKLVISPNNPIYTGC
ncbi:MAG: hypothetical protein NTX72_01080 [Candidatus Uhrbacteria bacterium]|nr:hypothetical protein [Candidatus Uhrbacteria bacterium]